MARQEFYLLILVQVIAESFQVEENILDVDHTIFLLVYLVKHVLKYSSLYLIK